MYIDEPSPDKVRENRLRRMAQRQGLGLKKSRARDPRARSYGGYMLIDVDANWIVAGAWPFDFSLTLDAVEEYLTDADPPGPPFFPAPIAKKGR
jgi:hypothetical protein